MSQFAPYHHHVHPSRRHLIHPEAPANHFPPFPPQGFQGAHPSSRPSGSDPWIHRQPPFPPSNLSDQEQELQDLLSGVHGPQSEDQLRRIYDLLGDRINPATNAHGNPGENSNPWIEVPPRRTNTNSQSNKAPRPLDHGQDSGDEYSRRDNRSKRSRTSHPESSSRGYFGYHPRDNSRPHTSTLPSSASLRSQPPPAGGRAPPGSHFDSDSSSASSDGSISSDYSESSDPRGGHRPRGSGRPLRRVSLRTRRRHNRRSRSDSPEYSQNVLKIAAKIGVSKRVVKKLMSREMSDIVGQYSDNIPAAVSAILQGTMNYDILFVVVKDLSKFESLRALDDGGVLQFMDDLQDQLVEEVANHFADACACEALKTNPDLRKWALSLIHLDFTGTRILPALRRLESHLSQTFVTERDVHASGAFRFSGMSPNVTRVTLRIMESFLLALRPWDQRAVQFLIKSWKSMLEHCVSATYMLNMESQLQPVCRAICNANKYGLRDLTAGHSFRFGSWSCKSRKLPAGCIREVSHSTGQAFFTAVGEGMVGYSIKKLLDTHTLKLVTPEMSSAFEKDGAAQILRTLHSKCNEPTKNPGATNAWTDEEVNRVTYRHITSWNGFNEALRAEKIDTEGKCTNTLCFSSGCNRENCPYASSHGSTQLLPVRVRARLFEKAALTKPAS